MSYFDVVLETLQGIQKELKATRHAILYQTKLLQESKETPKEAAPAPKEITWQEAVKALGAYCSGRSCAICEAKRWCKDYRKNSPCGWFSVQRNLVVPVNEEKED